jgi:nucleotide-binding universal stress UspA family protein
MAARILVPVDDSREARRAVEQAAELARRFDAGLALMTVIATSLVPRDALEPDQLARVEASFRRAGEAVLAQLRPVAEAAGVPVETKIVEGVPADEIVAEAARGYQFVVMGSHGAGLTGRDRNLLGSVSDRVLRQSPVPVLIVRDE